MDWKWILSLRFLILILTKMGHIAIIAIISNGKNINLLFWLLMFNIWHPFWLMLIHLDSIQEASIVSNTWDNRILGNIVPLVTYLPTLSHALTLKPKVLHKLTTLVILGDVNHKMATAPTIMVMSIAIVMVSITGSGNLILPCQC